MSEWEYPTAFSFWGKEENAAIARVYSSGRWTAGPEVEAFEDDFAKYHGRKFGVMTNSGSSANLVAAFALNHGYYRNRTGAVPAIAWSTTYAPFIQNNKELMVCDVDATWNAPDTIKYAHPGFIVGCSILGHPGYLKELRKAADSLKVPFIEDNCESLGAMTPEGKLTGTYGHVSTFSFFYSHQISAIEGGMILTDDKKLAKLCRLYADHGNAGWHSDAFEDKYDFQVHGFNVRGLELHAAIARAQLHKLDDFRRERLQNYHHFWSNAPYGIVAPRIADPKTMISPFGLAFEVVAGTEARSKLALALRSEGIDSRPPTGGSFLKHTYARPWRGQKTPNADRLHDTAMFIGLAPFPIPSLIEKALKVIKETL